MSANVTGSHLRIFPATTGIVVPNASLLDRMLYADQKDLSGRTVDEAGSDEHGVLRSKAAFRFLIISLSSSLRACPTI